MTEQSQLWVTINITQGDPREIIINKEKDVRIGDGQHVVKIRFEGKRIKDVLVDDMILYELYHV
jgi:hypothetical protein